jgi:hypothetical protein
MENLKQNSETNSSCECLKTIHKTEYEEYCFGGGYEYDKCVNCGKVHNYQEIFSDGTKAPINKKNSV